MFDKWWSQSCTKGGLDVMDSYINRIFNEFKYLGTPSEKTKQKTDAPDSPSSGDETRRTG